MVRSGTLGKSSIPNGLSMLDRSFFFSFFFFKIGIICCGFIPFLFLCEGHYRKAFGVCLVPIKNYKKKLRSVLS